MKRIFHTLPVLLFAVVARAQTHIYFDLNAPYFNASPASNRWVTWQPMTPFPGNLVNYTSGPAGTFYISNVFRGDYSGVIMARGNANRIPFNISVTPNETGVVNATNIVSVPGVQTYPPTGRSAWSVLASDARYAPIGVAGVSSNYVNSQDTIVSNAVIAFIANAPVRGVAAGTNIITTTNGGVVTVNSTATAGGDVTTLQLMTTVGNATNDLNTALRNVITNAAILQGDTDHASVSNGLAVTRTYGGLEQPVHVGTQTTNAVFGYNSKLNFRGNTGGFDWYNRVGDTTLLTLADNGDLRWGALPVFDSSAPSQAPFLQMEADGSLQRSFNLSAGTNLNASALASGTVNPAHIAATFSNLPIYYVDGTAADFTGHGRTPQSPWKSIAQAHTNLGATINSVELRVFGPFTYREQLTLGTNSTVRGYGADRPIFNAAEIVTGWTLVSGQTFTYAVSNFVVTGGGSATSFSVIENDLILHRVESLALCESTPASFYTALDPAVGSTNTVFVHPGGNTNPETNGRSYEVAKRNYGIFAGRNCQVIGVRTRNAMHNNGSLEVGRNAYVSRVKVENGTKHNMLFASGIVEDSEFINATTHPDGSIPVVAYDTIDGGSVVIRRCRVAGRPDLPISSSGIYGHTGGPLGAYARVLIEDTEIAYAAGPGGIGILTNGVQIFNRVIMRAPSQNGWLLYGGTNELRDCQIITQPDVPINPSAFVVSLRGGNARIFISGLKSAGLGYGISAETFGSGSHITVLHSILKGGFGVRATTDVSNNVFYVSNNVFDASQPYSLTTGNTLLSDSNCFPAFISATVNGTVYANWPAYQAALAPYDANSKTNNVQWNGEPLLGDYRVSSTSPAYTNQAGPGWKASPSLLISDTSGSVPTSPGSGQWVAGILTDFTNRVESAFLERTNDTSSGQTLVSPRVANSWTNINATTIQLEGINNVTMRLMKQATNHNLNFNFGIAGTDLGRISAGASAEKVLMFETLNSNPMGLAVNNNTLRISSGGAGSAGLTFDVNTARVLTVGAAGDFQFNANLILTNSTKAFSGNGGGLSNLFGGVISNSISVNGNVTATNFFARSGAAQKFGIQDAVSGFTGMEADSSSGAEQLQFKVADSSTTLRLDNGGQMFLGGSQVPTRLLLDTANEFFGSWMTEYTGSGSAVRATTPTITRPIFSDELTLSEQAAPGTPSTAQVRVYAKADGKVYSKDDAGQEYDLTATGSGIPATNTVIAYGDQYRTNYLSIGPTGTTNVGAMYFDTLNVTDTLTVSRIATATNTWGNDIVNFSRGMNLITNMGGNLTIAGIAGFSTSLLNEQYVLLNPNGATRTITVPGAWYVFGFTNGTTVASTNGTISWMRVEALINLYTNAHIIHGQ